MIIAGCDPGLRGALVLISRDGMELHTLPRIADYLNLAQLAPILEKRRPDIVFLEQVHAIFGASAGSTFKFGRVLGQIEGMLAGLRIAYQMVSPKTWQKELHENVEGKTAKEKSMLAASRIFPGVDFRENERCRKPHDGLVDAALIAEYGRRKLLAQKTWVFG